MTRFASILEQHRRVIVVGRSGVGKTTLVASVEDRPRWNVGEQGKDGDTPPEVGFVDNAYYWIDRLKDDAGPWLLEGTGCYRIMRAGLRDGTLEPDAVVHVLGRFDPWDIPPRDATGDPVKDEDKARVAATRAKAHETIWRDYIELRGTMGAKAELVEGTELDLSAEVTNE